MKYRRLAKHAIVDKKPGKERIQKEINASGETLDILIEILESKLESLGSELLSKTMYESPACTHRMADISGGMREIKALIKLLQVTEE